MIAIVAAEIVGDYHDRDPLLLSIREGAVYFCGVLIREILRIDPHFRPRLTEITVSTSGSDSILRQPVIKTDIDPRITVAGQSVIIVEDIRDRGDTLAMIEEHVLAKGALEVESAVLFERVMERPERFRPPRYVGIRLATQDWGIGSGLDDARLGPNGGRDLPGLYLNYPPGNEPRE